MWFLLIVGLLGLGLYVFPVNDLYQAGYRQQLAEAYAADFLRQHRQAVQMKIEDRLLTGAIAAEDLTGRLATTTRAFIENETVFTYWRLEEENDERTQPGLVRAAMRDFLDKTGRDHRRPDTGPTESALFGPVRNRYVSLPHTQVELPYQIEGLEDGTLVFVTRLSEAN